MKDAELTTTLVCLLTFSMYRSEQCYLGVQQGTVEHFA
jgi:hypothetical protein